MRAHAYAGLALAIAMTAACGDPIVAEVRPEIVVTATHADNGRKVLDFGPVPVLDRPKLSILVENRGRAELRLDGVDIEDASGSFRVGEDVAGVTVRAASYVEIPVIFEPPALGEYEGLLVLRHSDKSKDPVEVRLVGEGSTVGRVELEPEVIDFGLVGERMQETRTLTIRSVGTGPVIIDTIELVDSPPEFKFLGSTRSAKLPPPEDGQPGGKVDLRIACSPLATTQGESLEGTVRITTTDPDRREIFVKLRAGVNHAPIAVIEVEPGVHAIETRIGLDGSASSDPDGHLPLGYEWRVYTKAVDSNAVIDDPTAAVTFLVVDKPGTYEVALDVVDSEGLACYPLGGDPRLPCAKAEVTVKSDVDLKVELSWTHKTTDLDLHLIENSMPMYSSSDCYWANKTPDFGVFGDPADDPAMIRESLKGFGPETILFPKPAGGKYRVVVEYSKTNGAPDPVTDATLRVWIYGVIAAEYSRTLEGPGQLWDVLDIDWPSAVLTPIDSVHRVVR
ncbi:MAG TPA: hypothetical protein VGD74_05610 [Vulgatibacter sp.]